MKIYKISTERIQNVYKNPRILKIIKGLIITLNLIIGFMILIAIWDTIEIIFSKIRVILILNIVVLSLYFVYFFKKPIKKKNKILVKLTVNINIYLHRSL